MSQPMVVFLCTGNTCRSPLAMALARVRWQDAVTVESAGLVTRSGEAAADEARTVADELGGDLELHRSRPFERRWWREADWIIGMTRSHVAMLNRRLDENSTARLGLLGAPGEDLRGRSTSEAEEVADPIGGDVARYQVTAAQIDRLLAAWTPFVLADQPKADA